MSRMALANLSSLLVVVVVAGCGQSTEPKPASTAPPLAPPAVAPPTPWLPIQFVIEGGRLPPNYTGNDPLRFFEMFESKLKSIAPKDEFETSEEFSQRTNDTSRFAPISFSHVYGFPVDSIEVTYNADLEAYAIGGWPYRCIGDDLMGRSKWVTCNIAAEPTSTETYEGRNAFNASVAVTKVRGTEYAIALPRKHRAFKSKMFAKEPYVEWYGFKDRLPLPLEKARSTKGQKVAVLFVGQFTEPVIVQRLSRDESPTIDSPSDIEITEKAVPFDLKQIVYYIVETGEILKVHTL